jgi:hypothetical protein
VLKEQQKLVKTIDFLRLSVHSLIKNDKEYFCNNYRKKEIGGI